MLTSETYDPFRNMRERIADACPFVDWQISDTTWQG
jgi:hypothetical protein